MGPDEKDTMEHMDQGGPTKCCDHTEWQACVHCIGNYEGGPNDETIPITMVPTTTVSPKPLEKSDFVCRKPWCRQKIPGGQAEYEDHVAGCKKPRTKKSTVCPQCDKQFSKVSNLNRHVATVHSAERKYVCKNCNKSYSDVHKLDNHLQRCCRAGVDGMAPSDHNTPTIVDYSDYRMKDEEIVTVSPQGEHVTMVVPNGKDVLHNGGYVATSQNGGVTNHYDGDALDRLPKIESAVSMVHRGNEDSDSVDEKYKMTTLFSEGGELHIMKKRKTKSTVCIHCNKQFSRVSNLNRHIRIVHNQKKYSCKECSKTYTDAEKLHEHYVLMHTNLPGEQNGASLHMRDIDLNHEEEEEEEEYVRGIARVPHSNRAAIFGNGKPGLLIDVQESSEEAGGFMAQITALTDAQMKRENGIVYDEGARLEHDVPREGPRVVEDVEGGKVFVIDEMGLTDEDFSNNEDQYHSSDSGCDYSASSRDDEYRHNDKSMKKENNGYYDTKSYITPVKNQNNNSNGYYYDKPDTNGHTNNVPVKIKFPFQRQHPNPLKSKTVTCPHCQKLFSKRSNLNRHILMIHDIKFTCENCSRSFVQAEKLENHLLTSSCSTDNSYKLLKAETALPCMVIEEVFH